MKVVFAIIAATASMAFAQDSTTQSNPFGWRDFLIPSDLDLKQTTNWSEACSEELGELCADETERGSMFGCLLQNIEEDTVTKKCLNMLLARNAKTLRDVQEQQSSTSTNTPPPPTTTATTTTTEPAVQSYRVTCVAEIEEYCSDVQNSAVKGELFQCLGTQTQTELESTGETTFSDECAASLKARYLQANPEAAEEEGAAPSIIETCSTPMRIRLASSPKKCVDYNSKGKVTFKPCDVASSSQHFTVRPAQQGGYRFVNVEKTGCLDLDMTLKNCGVIGQTVYDITFLPATNNYMIQQKGTSNCMGGSKTKPGMSECPEVPKKLNKAAKKLLKANTFYIEPAFGYETMFSW